MSRSVTTPTTFSDSMTGRNPTFLSSIFLAAASSVSPGETVSMPRVITSRTFITASANGAAVGLPLAAAGRLHARDTEIERSQSVLNRRLHQTRGEFYETLPSFL